MNTIAGIEFYPTFDSADQCRAHLIRIEDVLDALLEECETSASSRVRYRAASKIRRVIEYLAEIYQAVLNFEGFDDWGYLISEEDGEIIFEWR